MSSAFGEPRTPVVLAVLLFVTLPYFVPERFAPGPAWVSTAIGVGFLVAMAVTDPGRINRRSTIAHHVRLSLAFALVAGSAWAAINLTDKLIQGHTSITANATQLLSSGGAVWLGLVISFTFLYWEVDLGGPGERANIPRSFPDLAFPEDTSPEIRRPDWRPIFVDYLYVGLTNAVAFSPTDTMPTAHWAKLAMGIQSLASLLIVGLVIARAVNILQ